MAVKLTNEFGSRANPSSAAYPSGSLKDETNPGVSNDGTPLSSRVGNDFQGFMQSALAEAGIDANGNPDSVDNPQILNALKKVQENHAASYTDIVYKASGGKSAVENMIIGAEVGNVCSADGTIFKRASSTGGLSDFQSVGPVYLSSFLEIGNTNALPALETCYSTYDHFIIDEDVNITLVEKTIESRTYPAGLNMNLPNKTIEFAKESKMTMDTVIGGRYSMFVVNADNNKIIAPQLIGDKDTHLDDPSAPVGQDEQGYGIRVEANGSNCTLVDPVTNKFWGDGIVWYTSGDGGYIQGKHYSYDCRRQGISVIRCGGLRIDHVVGEEIGVVNGAENGPWSTIDIEPDLADQFIKNISIGTIEGINNKGVCCLLALLALDDSAPFVDITIDNILSRGCKRAFEPRVDKNVKGKIYIKYILGKDSSNQDFQTVNFNNTMQLEIDKLVSVDCNKAGLTSSAFATPVGIYKNFSAESNVGNILIRSLEVINTTFLQHPVSMVNNFDSVDFGAITIEEIILTNSTFNNGAVHNPANAVFKTNSRIRKSFTGIASISNSEWINTIDNTGATGTTVVTVPTNYGYEGMLIELDHTATPEFRVAFADGFERSNAPVRSFAVGDKLLTRRISNQWSIESVAAGQWSQGGYGYYSYGMSAGGATSARPADPTPWMTFFDVNVGSQITYNNSTSRWVKSSDGTPV
ncbi:hypothetical protein NVP1112O_50 [Vibrio phage 1.112.O._10N.286.46.B11]|nr:hypothetical protein NVP1112O_50 [Vibrio phage 1.112.O._10N.286.46.B11]